MSRTTSSDRQTVVPSCPRLPLEHLGFNIAKNRPISRELFNRIGRLATFAMVSAGVKRQLDSVVPAVSCQDLRWYALRYRHEITRAHRRGGRSPTDGSRMVACAWPVH